jgi:integrase
MARSRAAKLETRTARLKLPAAKKPVFVKVGPRVGLGYRRTQSAGTWVARVADGKGGNWTKGFATADDIDEADGNAILTFWQAQDRARAIARASRPGEEDDGKPVTVARALDRYEADLKTRSADAGNVARVRQHLPDTLANKNVALLTMRELKKWRDGLFKHLAPASVNRTTGVLKAALNLAASQDEFIVNRQGWNNGLATIPDAQASRNVILEDQCIRTVIAEAHRESAEFGLLVEVAAVTGARVSQLARLKVEDLQGDRADARLMMPTSRKGRGQKKITHRPVPILTSLVTRLRLVVADRPSSASLLVKPSGEPWSKSDHSRLFRRAATRANLDPAEVTIYALRHSSIVRQILAGVPLRVVAVNHDTSVAMIERTYSKYIGDHADALSRAALLDTTPVPSADNVVPIATAG